MTLETHNHTADEPCGKSRTPLRGEARDNGVMDHTDVCYEQIGEFPLLTPRLEAIFASLICEADKTFQKQVTLLERAAPNALSGRNGHRTAMARALNGVNDLIIGREHRNGSGDVASMSEKSSLHARAAAALDIMILDACEASRTINKWAGLELPRDGLARRIFAVIRAREIFRNTTVTSDGEKAGALAAISHEAFRMLRHALPLRHPLKIRMDKMDKKFADKLAADGECRDYMEPLLRSGALKCDDLDTPRRVLLHSNLRLVVDVAKNYEGRGLDLEDLIAQGNLGLVRAINSYDPEHGTRFSTFAYFWIKETIVRYVRDQSRKIRIKRGAIDVIGKWRAAEFRLQSKLGRAPNEYEVQVELGLTSVQMEHARAALSIIDAQYHSIGCGGDNVAHDPMIASREPDALDSMECKDDSDMLKWQLQSLNTRERKIINLRYGLDGSKSMTSKEIALQLGLSRQRINQIERDVLGRMRDAMLVKEDCR